MKKYLVFTNSDHQRLCIDPSTIIAMEEISMKNINARGLFHTLIYCTGRTEPFSVRENVASIIAYLKQLGAAEFVDVK